jgi:hypothetical protein
MALLKKLRAACLAFLLLVPAGSWAAPSEYQVKAVFLYNFSRFVEWPTSAFAGPDAPFVVGIFGHDPFGADLDEVVRGETAGGRPLIVRRVRTAAEAAACQILFIHESEDKRLPEVIDALDHRSTLTVSDADAAVQRGVMIRLVTEKGRIRMRVNVESARAAQLTISSNLLRSAEIVPPAGAGVKP